METNEITGHVVNAAMKVHSKLGPGLFESAYEACMIHELRRRGLRVDVQVPVPIVYEEVRLEVGYRVDLLVEGHVVVELKGVRKILPVHQAQVLSYLRLGSYPVGLLLNFHVSSMKDGIMRFAN